MVEKKLNGEGKILLDHLTAQREQDKEEDKLWKIEHNNSAREFRNEIKEDISAIWSAMREGFDKLSEAILSSNRNNGWDWKAIGIMITLMFAVGGMLQQQIAFLGGHQKENIKSVTESMCKLDIVLQREMRLLSDIDNKNVNDMKIEINRIREWKDLVERSQGCIDSKQDANISHLKELIDVKASDRFTGKEGQAHQNQIDRLENRLTFVTKQLVASGIGVEKKGE